MSATAVQVVTRPRLHDRRNQPSRPLFYKNSGIFNLNGCLLEHGRFDTISVRKLQTSLSQGELFIVADLEDTWIRPFTNTLQREHVIDSVLNRAPFLITQSSVYYVAYSPTIGVEKLVVGDLDIEVLTREAAKTKVVSALANNLRLQQDAVR